ncbi:MAG: TIGR04282 family arsenosugar biosynthesis glycosyltransferase [Betaproteobacteria bacterium]|nr:TIGR04282 family arsenosugar biosynthesis glycosyltransferase [Betaproteobacteria bacterium]
MENDVVLIVFAKAPVPGEVKTRLSPALDAETAALLHAALVERALVIARNSGIEQVELCCAPDSSHTFFETCAEDFDIDLTGQGDGDLGQRMLRALQRGIAEHGAAIIIGADCPALTGKHIAEAARALDKHDAVLTPAEDGGYVLIGASRTDAAMFNDIDWGSDTVLASQRRNFNQLGFKVHEMPVLWDVDRPEDLPRLKALKPPLEFFWP